MLRRTDSTWRDKPWRRQALMHSKRKIPDSWRTDWKAKACTSFALYFKVFNNHLYYLRHVIVLSSKPCLHTQLPKHNRSYWKVSRGWGHLITWSGPIMGHLNSFSGGGNFPKIFQKLKCPGGCPGGCLSFDWLVHYGRLQSLCKRQVVFSHADFYRTLPSITEPISEVWFKLLLKCVIHNVKE